VLPGIGSTRGPPTRGTHPRWREGEYTLTPSPPRRGYHLRVPPKHRRRTKPTPRSPPYTGGEGSDSPPVSMTLTSPIGGWHVLTI
jgi:hypothetical protein